MVFKYLIIKKLFITKRDRLAPSSSTLLPPKKTGGHRTTSTSNSLQLPSADHWTKLPFIYTTDHQTVERIAGIDSLAAQVRVGFSSYRFLSPQDLLEFGRPCTKQQKANMTLSDHGGP